MKLRYFTEPVTTEEISSLPPIYRQAVELRDIQGKELFAIAQELRIPYGTLNFRLSTGRRMLQKKTDKKRRPTAASQLWLPLPFLTEAEPDAKQISTTKPEPPYVFYVPLDCR